QQGGYHNLVLRTHEELDLTDQSAVRRFLRSERPDYIFIAAAKVGGIQANNVYRAEFIYQNLAIEMNLIHGAYEAGIERLIFLGSSCIYPRDCPQPIREEYLLTGPLEATNEPYAIAKIAGIKLCESCNRQYATRYLCAMPSNLFGPGDHYDLETAHVLPALIRQVHEAKANGAKSITVWGSGKPRREFMLSDELADACVFMMEHNDALAACNGYAPLYNVGCGEDFSIRELAEITCEVLGYEGELVFDTSKPDGTPRKFLDVSKLAALGWRARIPLREGIATAYRDFLARAH
ncbi:MAG TPA: GDP-L-fucose synthase, partial [Burkholderiales bacterium]|nr:GDP-L-fucose synthase [Burkholderiales bacterium]